MQQQMALVTLGVSELTRSRRFYSDGLGWAPTLDLAEVVFYQVGHGLLLALFSLADLSADVGREVKPGSPFTLAHLVRSPAAVAEAIGSAAKAGGVVVKPAQTATWGGHHGYFADPDGHLWEVAYNPGLTVAPDGKVSIGPVEPS